MLSLDVDLVPKVTTKEKRGDEWNRGFAFSLLNVICIQEYGELYKWLALRNSLD